ncbi:MAG: hypothetical protein JO252_07795 [Planctomycetaceae bacterium]|nr:hypothetical protein [Planctomycetaceae bacterium]
MSFLACALHRLRTLRLLVAAALIGVDDEDAQVGTSRGDFLGAGAKGIGSSFLGIDAAGIADPLRVVDGVEPGIELGIPPPLDPDEESLTIVGE